MFLVGYSVQFSLSRRNFRASGEAACVNLSDDLIFLEYELHQQLLFKLRVSFDSTILVHRLFCHRPPFPASYSALASTRCSVYGPLTPLRLPTSSAFSLVLACTPLPSHHHHRCLLQDKSPGV